MKWLIFLFLTGCSTFTHGPYRDTDLQDLDCYSKFGAALGYCTKGRNY